MSLAIKTVCIAYARVCWHEEHLPSSSYHLEDVRIPMLIPLGRTKLRGRANGWIAELATTELTSYGKAKMRYACPLLLLFRRGRPGNDIGASLYSLYVYAIAAVCRRRVFYCCASKLLCTTNFLWLTSG